jgi:hypothetical protein
MVLAYLPKPKFSNTLFNVTQTVAEKKGMSSLLASMFFHDVMRYILAPLRLDRLPNDSPETRVQQPAIRLDPSGHHRLTISALMAWLSDLQEHDDLLGIGPNSCPKCRATFRDLDLNMPGVVPCRHRTGKWIIKKLHNVRKEYPDAGAWDFKLLVKQYGLSGVERVCWEGLPPVLDITRVMSLDLLHGGYKAFQDHEISMISRLVEPSQLDDRLIAQPFQTGVRSFHRGISKLSQFSGKETRQLLTMIVPAIAGAEGVPSNAEKAIAAKTDFLYMAHFPAHSDATIRMMMQKLEMFEHSKQVFIDTGVRRGKKSVIHHFRIPKWHNQLHFGANIKDLGPMVGTSCEPVEYNHQASAKMPYHNSNRKNYFPQFVDYDARRTVIDLAEEYFEYRDDYMENDDALPTAQPTGPVDSLAIARELGRLDRPTQSHAKRPHRTSDVLAIMSHNNEMNDLPSALARYFMKGGNRGLKLGSQRQYFEYNQLPLHLRKLHLWSSAHITIEPANPYFPRESNMIHCCPPQNGKTSVYDAVLVQVNQSVNPAERKHNET